MGVYIPNETMPKDCYTCFCYETEFNMCSLTGKRLDDIRLRQDDCPLIEIVTCRECKWLGVDDGMPFCYWWLREIEPDVFCSYGERKNDDYI